MYYDGIITKPPLNELYHHGIKGQKWGVRNGPPYPLKSHSGSEKKAKASSDRGSIQKKKPIMSGSKGDIQKKTNDKIGFIDPVSAAILTTYAAVAVTALVVHAKANHKKKVEFLKARENTKHIDELREGAEIDPKTGLRLKKDQNSSMEDDMAAVNYDRGVKKKYKGTYTNCGLCTTAYDLRRRGYEVSSTSVKGTPYANGVDRKELESWYKDGAGKSVKFVPDDRVSDINMLEYPAGTFKAGLLQQPDGARGNLVVFWGFGGGHSMAYEIKDRKVIVLDTQSNMKYEGSELDELLNSAALVDMAGNQSFYLRTDNLEPDYEALKRKGIIQ